MSKNLLATIESPEDLRKLPPKSLQILAAEIREMMINVVSKTGGHLAPSLGSVELTLALHYCFNTPDDKLVWDVGHQAYTHKLITGRRDRFATLRQHEGISGFPRVSESEYDTCSTGHASTSISTALGMAIARDLQKRDHAVVAIIGDGSLGGGLAFEGLNNLGSSNTGMIVILNDNEMSISRNVGALSHYLTKVITDKRYTKFKAEIWDRLGGNPVGKSIRSIVKNIDEAVKHAVIPGKLFEDMGIRYLGPIDGHNIAAMINVFRALKEDTHSPQLVHIITKKGKGYQFAEKDATKYHGVGSFSLDTGDLIATPAQVPVPTYSDVFGDTIAELATSRPAMVAITAAMRDGTKLTRFAKKFPDRFFDVGIAESHAVTFAAGLAHSGMLPVVALYSTFLQRTYDQLMHDIALDHQHVIFCIDRAGLVGDDGPTHHGMFDLSFVRSVPGAVIMAPSNGDELRNMMYTAVEHCTGPVFIRYPRGATPRVPINESFTPIPLGLPDLIRDGREIALVSIGDFLPSTLEIAEQLSKEGYSPAIINARFAKPLDAGFYRTLFENFQTVVTLENNSLAGGFGSGVLELMHTLDIENKPDMITIGLPDSFISHGDKQLLMKSMQLDPESIAQKILTKLRTPKGSAASLA